MPGLLEIVTDLTEAQSAVERLLFSTGKDASSAEDLVRRCSKLESARRNAEVADQLLSDACEGGESVKKGGFDGVIAAVEDALRRVKQAQLDLATALGPSASVLFEGEHDAMPDHDGSVEGGDDATQTRKRTPRWV